VRTHSFAVGFRVVEKIVNKIFPGKRLEIIDGQDQSAVHCHPTATGGRNGHTESSDGLVKADLSVPQEMGGPGKPGTATPEHLFAAGYAACFGGALDFIGKQHKKDASKARITCAVTIGPREGGGFGLAVKLRVEDKSLPQAELAALATEAHEKICPYSHPTRGNVDVTLEVVSG
jgi:lipoyl-dependent peroxiredoxin